MTHQVDDSNRCGFVLSALGEEEKAFARLRGPSSVGMSDIRFFIVDVSAEVLGLNGIIGEPEEFLRETEAPK
jgi:hypothetical protein